MESYFKKCVMGKKKWEFDTSEIYMANYHPVS